MWHKRLTFRVVAVKSLRGSTVQLWSFRAPDGCCVCAQKYYGNPSAQNTDTFKHKSTILQINPDNVGCYPFSAHIMKRAPIWKFHLSVSWYMLQSFHDSFLAKIRTKKDKKICYQRVDLFRIVNFPVFHMESSNCLAISWRYEADIIFRLEIYESVYCWFQ